MPEPVQNDVITVLFDEKGKFMGGEKHSFSQSNILMGKISIGQKSNIFYSLRHGDEAEIISPEEAHLKMASLITPKSAVEYRIGIVHDDNHVSWTVDQSINAEYKDVIKRLEKSLGKSLDDVVKVQELSNKSLPERSEKSKDIAFDGIIKEQMVLTRAKLSESGQTLTNMGVQPAIVNKYLELSDALEESETRGQKLNSKTENELNKAQSALMAEFERLGKQGKLKLAPDGEEVDNNLNLEKAQGEKSLRK